jgi:hypothetical protein
MPLTAIAQLESGLWSQESGVWTLESGVWSLDSGLWTLDSVWSLESGLWTLESAHNTDVILPTTYYYYYYYYPLLPPATTYYLPVNLQKNFLPASQLFVLALADVTALHLGAEQGEEQILPFLNAMSLAVLFCSIFALFCFSASFAVVNHHFCTHHRHFPHP